MTRYTKQIYPAVVKPLAGASGYPASGFFAMHITYPNTEYGDDVTTWQYGANSNNWKQGLSVIVRTPLATASAPSEADNVIVVDLKTVGAAVSDYTYDLGTEEATRYIAAKINSRRVKQVSKNGTRYLRARYVRMSGKPTYTGSAFRTTSDSNLILKFDGAYRNGFPSDLPTTGTITYNDGDHTNLTLNYTAISGYYYGPKRLGATVTGQDSKANFTITENLSSTIDQVSSHPDTLSGATFEIAGEPKKHTIVMTWEQRPTSANWDTDHNYWAPANGGPIIQGLGQSVPTWNLLAKPLDGGNMGLPATNYESKGSTATAHTTGHGYVRFSVEGLNSCELPDIPPPDYTVTQPSFRGITKVDSDTTGSNKVKMANMEYGTKLPMASGDILHTKEGYKATTGASTNIVAHTIDELTSVTSYSGDFVAQGLKYDNTKYAPRPIFTAKSLNTTTKVKGLQISNENMVFEDLITKDDQGNTLTLFGGSPWGVVIRDYKLQNTREDPITGEEITGPSTTDGKLTPNLSIQLPNPSEIPGEVFVRSGHDRIQAYSNMTWGLGGLTSPDPRKPGVAEASNQASQFDTHDRTLIFHVQRLLHPDMATKQGLTPHTTAGAVPSGSTRLFSAHRITDHAERGSVLTQTNNGNPTGNAYPHHRIRFARQGHSFVTPFTHRGTPAAMRRQLHRSHGSSYSLLFEAETEHKHHGFGSGKSSNSTTVFELDTLDTKGQTDYDHSTGSFASDGLPLGEIKGFRLPDVKAAYSSVTPRDDLDYLIAPGQEHTKKLGVGHQVRRATLSEDVSFSVAGPTKMTLATALSGATRYNTGSEVSINGILLGDYLLAGGSPMPAIGYSGSSAYFVTGREEGVAVPRIGTELATVPPLLCHDPEYVNLAARNSGGGGITASNADLALLSASDTGTGAKPDAFLCNWLAEYSHPAFFGTSREHFLTFRYREAGMPRSLNYPPVRGLYLRNHSHASTTAQAENALAIERLYVYQWLQNYGYNGLNAGGHGNTDGLRSANAVLMGHTTVREAQGTLRLLKQYENIRYSRGEGIGDGINPEREGGIISYDVDTDSETFTKYIAVRDSMVAYDMSRRLPIRAWGIRTASDALDMLAGDPNEGTNTLGVFGKARFDGGIHDSVQKIPNATDHGASWFFDKDYSGVERSTPIGIVLSGHTADATPYSSAVRRSNLPANSAESPIGIGLTLGLESGGMTLPTSMPAGLWDVEYLEAPLKARPYNKGSDPFIDLTQYTGSNSYAQSKSNSSVSSTAFGVSGGFHHLRGNALHTNASAIDHSGMRTLAASNGEKKTHYPTTGWGEATYNSSNNATKTVKAIPLSEISDHRQVQSRTEPRLGLIIDTENERNSNKTVEYQVMGTKATSLNADLSVGQHFPITPSWVSKTKLEKDGFTLDGGVGSSVTHSNEYVSPTWSPDSDDAKGMGGAAITAITLTAGGTGYSDGNLTASGGGGSNFAGTYLIARQVASVTLNSLRFDAGPTTDYRAVITTNTVSSVQATQAIVTFTVNGQLTATAFSVASAGANFLSSHTQSIAYEVSDGGGNWIESEPSNGSITVNLSTTGAVKVITMTNGGSGYTSEPTIAFQNAGSNATIAVTVGSGAIEEPVIHSNTHALDAWAVRGSADLPAWGGVYILRKTYLNRTEEGSLSTEIFGTSGKPMTSHPRRKSVDYIVRPVRPLKLFAFASSLLQDGWTHGPRCKTTNSDNIGYQPFTRDGRYGLFETDVSQGLGNSSFVGSPEGAFTMDWPDANDYDVAWHLIPTASMLQFFKSDAARKTVDGSFNPEIEPRYSQTLHPGGGEPIHQSQVRYINDGSGIGGDFAKHGLEDEVTHQTLNSIMRTYPSFEVKSHYTAGSTYLILEDASILPSSGVLFIPGVSGKFSYSAKSGDKLTQSGNTITGYTSVGDLVGKVLHYTTVSSPSSINDIRALTLPYPVLPTLTDNTLVIGKIESDSWRRYDTTLDSIKETALTYRGLLEYDPSDFIMTSQRPLMITNSKNIAEVKNASSSIQKIRVDGKELSESFSPPYLFDKNGFRLRIGGVKTENNTTSLIFKNINSDTLSDHGLDVENGVFLGQLGFVGIRTSDAALMLLDDAEADVAGYNVTPTSALISNDREISDTLKAHPSLRIINDHSSTFVARKTRGISILEAIKNLTQLDGRQLVNERNGGLIYGSSTFKNKGATIGMGSIVKSVGVSRMIDSPNEVIVSGDDLASNEKVYVAIKDPERMRNEAGKGASSNLARVLKQNIPGLKTKQEATKLAKSILARTENTTPVIEIKGAVRATDITPGDMIGIDLPLHGLRGEYAVFEAEHNYNQLESNFVVGQYDKGIEGLLSDLQSISSTNETTDESASNIVDLVELTVSGAIKIKAVHRISVRSVNNRGFLIGAKEAKGMGKIGVRSGDKRALPIGQSKSIYYVVK